jgi:prevent-host-death family protein
MARVWQLQEAKSRFSQVVDEALEHGPQVISRRGEEVVVILAYAEYKQMKKAELPLGDFFRQSPLSGAEELDLTRDQSPGRLTDEL